jgi:hypothetical protein
MRRANNHVKVCIMSFPFRPNTNGIHLQSLCLIYLQFMDSFNYEGG